MASTYSNLKIQLMATGENSTTWGNVTNTNLGTAIEEAIVGSADVTFASANQTLTLTDTNATQTARHLRLRCTGTTGGSTRNLVVPSIEKPYIVQNDCADGILVKTAAGTGITVPAGKTMWVYSDGTNVVDVSTHLTSLTLASPLAVTSGGTGSDTASGARTNLGATNIGGAIFTLADTNAIRFIRINADNTVSVQDAPAFRVSIDAPSATGGNASGTWSISITGNAGTVTNGVYTSGTYADPAWITSLAGSKISGNISGNAGNVTGTVAVANGGTGATDAATARSNLGAGTVTSVSGTGSANGLSLSGTVTSSGNITLSGSVTSVARGATIDGVTIGYRSIPRSTTSGTATTGDVGKVIAVTAGITIPNATFAAGDAVSIYNDSAASVTITQGTSLTLRQAGTTNTGNRTLAARGMATIWFNSSSEAIISGSGVS